MHFTTAFWAKAIIMLKLLYIEFITDMKESGNNLTLPASSTIILS